MRVFLFLIFCLCPFSGHGMEYSLGVGHYANVMEFWHQKPQPELLRPLLRTLTEKGQLAMPEKQMFLGAFFSRLLSRGELSWRDFAQYCAGLPASGKRACAWAAHLGGIPEQEMTRAGFLDGSEALFAVQLRKTPENLRAWTPREPAIIQMFWAAFMADGDSAWLEPVLACALGENCQPAASRAAAASFWEYAPRHGEAADLLKARLARADSRERKLLEAMLAGAAPK